MNYVNQYLSALPFGSGFVLNEAQLYSKVWHTTVGLGLCPNVRKEFHTFFARQGKIQYSQERLSVTVASVYSGKQPCCAL